MMETFVAVLAILVVLGISLGMVTWALMRLIKIIKQM